MVGKLGLESLGDDLADGLDQAEQDDCDSTSEEEEDSDVDNEEEDQSYKGDNSCVRDNSNSDQIS